jgi:hypothetical protein
MKLESFVCGQWAAPGGDLVDIRGAGVPPVGANTPHAIIPPALIPSSSPIVFIAPL